MDARTTHAGASGFHQTRPGLEPDRATPQYQGVTDPAAEDLKTLAWARVWAAIRPPYSRSLRAGAWYPVVRNELPDRVTILMGDRTVDAPRRLFEIRPKRPDHFSVVHRIGYEPDPKRKSQHNLGKKYGVCPECAWRFALWGTPTSARCPQCGHKGEVGWWE
jgi:hypothetical protein